MLDKPLVLLHGEIKTPPMSKRARAVNIQKIRLGDFMHKSKKEKLKKLGYEITNTKEFLNLSFVEAALVELKIVLSQRLKKVRAEKKISQVALAKRLGSSQSRVAKIEGASDDVTLDLIFKALFSLGDSPKTLAKVISSADN